MAELAHPAERRSLALQELRRAADVRAFARRLLGTEQLGPTPRDVKARPWVVHVCSAVQVDGGLQALKIGEGTPRSEHDRFVLSLVRAHASALLISGKLLRDEPHVRFTLQGPRLVPAALAAFRRELRGADAPLPLLVLSRNSTPDQHPALKLSPFELVSRADGPSGAVALAAARDIDVLSIEAGPRVAGELYVAHLISEVVLSIYEGFVEPELHAGALPSLEELTTRFGEARSDVRVVEPSGPWRFLHFRRSP